MKKESKQFFDDFNGFDEEIKKWLDGNPNLDAKADNNDAFDLHKAMTQKFAFDKLCERLFNRNKKTR